jgi:hypothetical protein
MGGETSFGTPAAGRCTADLPCWAHVGIPPQAMPERPLTAASQHGLGATGGQMSIRMNDPSQIQRFSQDTDRGSHSRLRPKLAAAHHVAWVVVMLTGGIVALALGHFGIGLAAVLLSTPAVILGLRAWLRNGRSEPLQMGPGLTPGTETNGWKTQRTGIDAARGSFEVGDHHRQPD